MITKNKLIALCVCIIVLLVVIISIYAYINNLNNKITRLTNTITERDAQIAKLNQDVAALEKNLESFNNTIEITDQYIGNVEKINLDENEIKQSILEEVLHDDTDEIKDWFNESLPSNVINIINDGIDKRMCQDNR